MIREIALRTPGGYNLQPPVEAMPTAGLANLRSILRFGVSVLLGGATLLALFFLIWGGIQWITSGGDKAAVEAARKKLTYAIIGLVIAFSAFLIINVFNHIFRINLLDPGCGVNQRRIGGVCRST